MSISKEGDLLSIKKLSIIQYRTKSDHHARRTQDNTLVISKTVLLSGNIVEIVRCIEASLQ